MSEVRAKLLPMEKVRTYCETQPIATLSLLSAAFTDWLRPNTDIGMLVEYLPDATITYIDMARQERELAKIIGGAIDLRTANELERTVKQQILEEATLVFAQDT